ncbi:Magnesium transport protein CorA [Madurella mycetomatis]|uniref:Magnesium transport protein CorA n=1 Tax=Madurella mycetomatis TaxID=100816 RepID=A0A175VXP1_9PEZI|nr:Magnesium transport protein CorA [Madurella mycetomatis]KXX82968.1 Magnesium transport protein CorA [Madurella mycetomatis]
MAAKTRREMPRLPGLHPVSAALQPSGSLTTFRTLEDSPGGVVSQPNISYNLLQSSTCFGANVGLTAIPAGAEPGFDPTKSDGGQESMGILSSPSQIRVIDFSPDRISFYVLENETLPKFLGQPGPNWAKCRWINVNGLSWDVVRAIGEHKNLHRLAIENILHTTNRTKAEWFPNHVLIILTLQKLVKLHDPYDDFDSVDSSVESVNPPGVYQRFRLLFPRRPATTVDVEHGLRTLQGYYSSPSDPRVLFLEKYSALRYKDLAVACEQVSLFITDDNTVITFFEQSANDVEVPIVRRLQNPGTILRESCQASMVAQAIVDAIVDLAIPVAASYGEAIGDLELDVLTGPTLEDTKSLYLAISEINQVLNFINPIITLINTLRDHRMDASPEMTANYPLENIPTKATIITPLAYTYFGDILDHCVSLTDSLNQLKTSANGMIDLIFNTISAYQNNTMKQLTVATIIFLPLTFITAYFGQEFQPFTDLNLGIMHFWKIAIPVVFATAAILFGGGIYSYFKSLLQRRSIRRMRETHLRRHKMKSI